MIEEEIKELEAEITKNKKGFEKINAWIDKQTSSNFKLFKFILCFRGVISSISSL